jgi:hypothetical protein
MAYGLCDVPQCEEETYMGWRPRSVHQRLGKQICRIHFERHKDNNDKFSLYDAFGFERPPTITKTVKLKDYCSCGRERQPAAKYCTSCIAERKRQQRKESYHRLKSRTVSDNSQEEERKILICRNEGCNNERQLNHRYCQKCAQRRSQKSNRERQRRHYKKNQITVMA